MLSTNLGPLDIELWPKEAPLACRNFVQLSLDGYYDDCIFHRVIKGFMIQTGDPTGTGQGGESAFGKAFKDEVHPRLRFNHRGLVACANENVPDSNHSQFFLTLDKCDHLNGKHTIFGKVAGATLFNALRIAEVETSGDVPTQPVKITAASVVVNPFPDLVARPRSTDGSASGGSRKVEAGGTRKKKRKKIKNANLLSFADPLEEDQGQASRKRARKTKKKTKKKKRKGGSDADATHGRRVEGAAAAHLGIAAPTTGSHTRRAACSASARTVSASESDKATGAETSAATADSNEGELGASVPGSRTSSAHPSTTDKRENKRKRSKEKRLLERLERFKGKLAFGGSSASKALIETEAVAVADGARDFGTEADDDGCERSGVGTMENGAHAAVHEVVDSSAGAKLPSSSASGSWLSGQLVFKGKHFEDAQRFS